MDRLICGDVGYGKTEIAVRAAFKAVQDGKQVAVLVPTTLLAQQHFNTFTERMAQFPVVIRQLSRFQTPKEAERDAGEAAERHASTSSSAPTGCCQTSTRFKDLGLVIVDEEQRFGVEHKEQLKALRANVDVLTMSATPIPRTLEMAITGIREMSTIATPPEERHPVLTYVGGVRRQAGRRRDPPRAAARRPGLLPAQPGRVDRQGGAPAARAGARGAGRGGARPDGRGRPGAGDGRLLGEGVRRPGLHHDRRVRHRHPERQHADRGAGRPARPGPAAPDPRPGRPGPRAGVRVLPLPAGEAADRAGARAAGHHRAAHRAGRRHVRGDEGPGDPRRRQPARRRAVRAHRGRRLRPVRADGRRGGAGSSRASGRRRSAEVKIDLPVDAHLPHDYIDVGAAAPGDVPQAGRGPRRRPRWTRSSPR